MTSDHLKWPSSETENLAVDPQVRTVGRHSFNANAPKRDVRGRIPRVPWFTIAIVEVADAPDSLLPRRG